MSTVHSYMERIRNILDEAKDKLNDAEFDYLVDDVEDAMDELQGEEEEDDDEES